MRFEIDDHHYDTTTKEQIMEQPEQRPRHDLAEAAMELAEHVGFPPYNTADVEAGRSTTLRPQPPDMGKGVAAIVYAVLALKESVDEQTKMIREASGWSS